jgi:hypothetical protein
MDCRGLHAGWEPHLKRRQAGARYQSCQQPLQLRGLEVMAFFHTSKRSSEPHLHEGRCLCRTPHLGRVCGAGGHEPPPRCISTPSASGAGCSILRGGLQKRPKESVWSHQGPVVVPRQQDQLAPAIACIRRRRPALRQGSCSIPH